MLQSMHEIQYMPEVQLRVTGFYKNISPFKKQLIKKSFFSYRMLAPVISIVH
jgi:hypothetical protein